MNDQLNWQIKDRKLLLSGELERQTLTALWHQREAVMDQVNIIDVSALGRVDTAGLALLVHLRQIAARHGNPPCFAGITEKLQTLISLYNLQQIITNRP